MSYKLPIVLLISLASASAAAYGPGVHIREAELTLQMLSELDPEWAELAETPMAIAYLRMGSLAPDFQWISDSLTFGHAKSLSYHLLDTAETLSPEYRLFALGHLAHNGSDASAEVFLTPTIFAAYPLGMVDMFDSGHDDAQGESEGIVEAYGDLINGDWDAVVDLLFDLRLDSDEAAARFDAMFLWYCHEGVRHHGLSSDCDQILGEVNETLSQADALLAGMDREEAHEFVDQLLDRPPVQLIELFTGGLLSSFLGDYTNRSPHFDAEVRRVEQSALVDADLWAIYEDEFVDLGPILTIEHINERVEGWPRYYGNAIRCGNLQSVMQFLPEVYDVDPALHVDEVTFFDGDGAPISAVDTGLVGRELRAELQIFASMPVEATVRGVVRKDRPGFDPEGDEIVGEATVAVVVDPREYTTTARTLLSIPFIADTDDALGFYVELYRDDVQGPWFTTSWDQMWSIGELELDWGVYRDNFATYGHWPPSLPIAEPASTAANLFVKVRVYPEGRPIAGARVHLPDLDREAFTAVNGIAVLDGLEPGTHTLTVEGADDYLVSMRSEVVLEPLQDHWAEVGLEAIPRVESPGGAEYWGDPACIPVVWNAPAFSGQAETFKAQIREPSTGSPLSDVVDVGRTSPSGICVEPPLADGTSAEIALWPVYEDETTGEEGHSPAFGVDASPPEITGVTLSVDNDITCLNEVPAVPPLQVKVTIVEPHSPIVTATAHVGPFQREFEFSGFQVGPIEEARSLDFSMAPDGLVPGDALTIVVTNAAGWEATSEPVALPVWDESHRCPPRDDLQGHSDAPAAGGDDSGCAIVAGAKPRGKALWLIAIGLFAVLARSTRRGIFRT